MKLIERYLHEVGRHLPGKNRVDILAELNSHLTDTLEERFGSSPTEENVVSLLKETGEPRKVAASYSGSGQYLIGPDLYPFFRMVVGIVLAAVIGAQLLSFGISLLAGNDLISNWESWAGLLTSIPSALGSVVIVFLILQRVGVKPEINEEEWNPRSLPELDDETVKIGERIFGIVMGSIFLAIFVAIPEKIGIYLFPGGEFYPDPVIMQYLPWIVLSLLVGIGMDVYLVWQGRWTLGSRIARIAVNLFNVGVLVMLVQGHTAWLAAHGSTGFFASLSELGESMSTNMQLFGMEVFRMAFFIALIVTIVETCVMLFKLIRGSFAQGKEQVKLS